MRYLFISCIAALIFSCKSSDKKNEIVSPLFPPIDSLPPPSMKFIGELQEAWRWGDKTGENILVTSYVKPYDDTGDNEDTDDGKTAGLHAAQYLKVGDKYDLVWKNEEEERSCPFDITCEFVKKATTVTDLDKDSISEVTYLVRLACRSDVSPAEMKLIMHEGKDMYVLKGLSWIRSSPEDSFTVTEQNANLETLPGYNKTEDEYMKTFGRYESEKGFASAPPEFLAFARKQWMKFVIESFE